MKEHSTLIEYIDYWCTTTPNNIAIIYENKKITYSELYINTVKCSEFLTKKGYNRGDTIVLYLDCCPEFFYILFSASLLGLKILSVNTRCTLLELSNYYNASFGKCLICKTRKETLSENPNFSIVYTSELQDYINNNSFICFNTLQLSAQPSDIYLLIPTSGTTGNPKIAELTQLSIIASVSEQLMEFGAPSGYTNNDVIQHQVPISHVSGSIQFGIAPLIAGSTLVLNSRFDAERILKNTEQYRATILAGVPTMWKLMFDVLKEKSYDLSSVRWCMSGAAPIEKELVKKIFEICPIVSNPLGMTETSGFCSGFHGVSDIEVVASTVGKIFENLNYKIIDANTGKKCKLEEVGLLVLKGPSVINSYINHPISLTSDGYYITNDLASEDDNGYIKLFGRYDDMFTVGGYNVYPTEIETYIKNNFAVKDVAIVPKPHETMGNVCKAFIVPDDNINIDEVIQKMDREIIYYKIPKDIVLCDSLPKNNIGKIIRRKII